MKKLQAVLMALMLSASDKGGARSLAQSAADDVLPGTRPLEMQGDLAAALVSGIDAFLTRELAASAGRRGGSWQQDFTSLAAYERSVQKNRERFHKVIGLVDPRTAPAALELVGALGAPPAVARGNGFNVCAFSIYKSFSAQLAERGFVVFAPQNPYIGQDKFRVLQRKANPLKLSLFSFIVRQHERLLDWLAGQPFVDPGRIGFYGLSYGGKAAVRVPPLLVGRYALSICSADFNEWILKNTSLSYSASYMFTGEYEMPEFDLGNTFNYAELTRLMVPRPFMVERGHRDGVAPDEWVAYEYAKVRRMYTTLGIGDRITIEFFNVPHEINGVGTFEFLEKHLK